MMEKLKNLSKLRMKGNMYLIIKTIYAKTLNETIGGTGKQEKFQIVRRVRLGCRRMSYTLRPLTRHGNKRMKEDQLLEKKKTFTLKFADDVVLVADHLEGLTSSMIKALEKFVRKNKY